jgi:hypothetical protein
MTDPALTVTLPRSMWVALLSSLGQRPYGEVCEVIEEIVRQAGAQLECEPRPSETQPKGIN